MPPPQRTSWFGFDQPEPTEYIPPEREPQPSPPSQWVSGSFPGEWSVTTPSPITVNWGAIGTTYPALSTAEFFMSDTGYVLPKNPECNADYNMYYQARVPIPIPEIQALSEERARNEVARFREQILAVGQVEGGMLQDIYYEMEEEDAYERRI